MMQPSWVGESTGYGVRQREGIGMDGLEVPAGWHGLGDSGTLGGVS